MEDIIEATATSPPNAPDPFDSPWSCRLPAELMDMVSKILAEDGDLGTLGALQATDSKLYKIATPHLYRKLEFNGKQSPALLFDMFHDIPYIKRETFLRPLPISRCHPLRMCLALRLRYALGHTTHIFIDYIYYLDPVYLHDFLHELTAYHDIHMTMRTLDPIATLWPSLLEVKVQYPDFDNDSDAHDLLADLTKIHVMLFSPDPRPRNVLHLMLPYKSKLAGF
jgi:hypothetical protein